MDLQLKGKHVLITGASRGIGLACAQAFLEEGARVSLVARNAEVLGQAADGLNGGDRVAHFATDLGDADAALATLDAAEAAFGPVDVLVNSAGAAKRAAPSELTPAKWHAAMDAKYFTYIHMIDPTVKRMAERGAGAIVNVIGMGGKLGNPAHLAGGSANAALMLASAGLAAAYAKQGVRVNAVNPGPVLTERLKAGMEVDARMAASEGRPAPADPGARMAMGRVARPDEIAAMVVFLASDKASYVNGAIIPMDGATTPTVV
ncbi:SDR family oxidoreductase [Xylophilus rhododendri]|uniref:SDR family oxidoreductase n=1 Tax=Xylophilus rhododendri TaxID=2697032 RepID=A0A857IZ07_9BURK|nr:SDR family oxidoreductase [Xylophilus rhododendri]QHI96527.1 SDR family oxidoreductase [Xylophilus rhododendri]